MQILCLTSEGVVIAGDATEKLIAQWRRMGEWMIPTRKGQQRSILLSIGVQNRCNGLVGNMWDLLDIVTLENSRHEKCFC